ncbi:MAG: dihydropteroate synthase [Acidobacteria bacterium]|nr:dihydropteroate synthase [Acidobacteriota bacterium]
MTFAPRRSFTVPLPDRAPLVLGERCLVMGILNVSPDSFAERTSLVDPPSAIAAALSLEADGADLIDVGGESTRPGASPVSANEELARVLPVIRGLAGRLKVPISVDTYKAEVARAALDAGAVLVNDISGLRFDPALARVAAEGGAALVLMHTRGGPATMHADAVYGDLIGEIAAELRASVARALEAGIPAERIILDPGIGFAKRPSHSYGVLARLPELVSALDRPLLVGPSRKSFMREALNDRPAPERDWGTAAAVTAAVLAGAHIVRVHAVREMVQVVRVADGIREHTD